mmetsp:Transcript_30406/g.98853  ORF Transcript_30406/g.98853 Transcript_30406/m.98853 type:complete len:117 (-) Transcript_30406:83-433(-)
MGGEGAEAARLFVTAEQRRAELIATTKAELAAHKAEMAAKEAELAAAAEEEGKAKEAAQEAEAEDDTKMCVCCLTQPKTHVAIPCGHRAVCGGCVQKLDFCPLCRASPVQFLFVFE